MLNFVSITNPINLQYTEMMERFLMNTVAFSVALVTKDYSTFSQEVRDIMAADENWLKDSVEWSQSLLVLSLVDGENYQTADDVAGDLSTLLALYNIATQRELTDREDALFVRLHDRFLALLLTDEKLIEYLLEEQDE
ncbi:DUF3206 domain-containing protein [Enterococcus asini]|uniref:DUF3206 domain-containing protein n=1 Tax=Enterococcus asini TaxID=57732 RepID=UPI002890E23D|nr:DUF3206 domain-containing protein [Enterococcus asini]MDT2744657.1 DUF3206 domain-containing protein [Enterococcus asini]